MRAISGPTSPLRTVVKRRGRLLSRQLALQTSAITVHGRFNLHQRFTYLLNLWSDRVPNPESSRPITESSPTGHRGHDKTTYTIKEKFKNGNKWK
ncbi:hypothetical protein AVEN_1171-1 [Araneus ventricosus]|uniref:Uncharacterized protein n=1 Tax=Araneus ventricosus TaxID=182803 RepID=A0A4Y2EFD4_ARAVE|nr:hypothetical protein AVEN_1171-1 [Araneus ventricosus]